MSIDPCILQSVSKLWDERRSSLLPDTLISLNPSEEIPTGVETSGAQLDDF